MLSLRWSFQLYQDSNSYYFGVILLITFLIDPRNLIKLRYQARSHRRRLQPSKYLSADALIFDGS